jgi:phospholipid transport system substrate-binding protein
MRHIPCIALGVALLTTTALARPGFTENGPVMFVAKVGRDAEQILKDTGLSAAVRRQEFTALLRRNFDLPAIARFTLGSYWRAATPLQRQRFLGALDAYLVHVFWPPLQHLQQFPDVALAVVGERPLGTGFTLVRTKLRWPDGQRPVKLDWTVSAQGGGYKIVDLSIDNVDQRLAERSEFGDLLARNGGSLPALIASMRVESSQLISHS